MRHLANILCGFVMARCMAEGLLALCGDQVKRSDSLVTAGLATAYAIVFTVYVFRQPKAEA